MRWVKGEWRVVGKAMFCQDDLTVVMPGRRRFWETQEGKLVIENNVELELDIIGLQE